MANIIRSAKSGNEWTDNELEAYNIKITFQDAPTFFGETPLPTPAVDQEVLTALTADDAVNDTVYSLLTQLELAMMPSEPGESAVDEFAVALFHSFGYTHRPRAVRTCKELRFIVCGERKYAKPTICIIDRNANDIDNNARRRSVGLEEWDSKVVPGIIMAGTSPSFFKIPITHDLARCVERGQYPPTPTIVTGHVPDIPRPNRRFSDGMKPLDNRRAILQCYEAFKKFVF